MTIAQATAYFIITVVSVYILTAAEQTPSLKMRYNFTNFIESIPRPRYIVTVNDLIRRWAPLVWLAPGERFFPGSTNDFLENTTPVFVILKRNKTSVDANIPAPKTSGSWFLVSRENPDVLLKNSTSFLYGNNPQIKPVPVYALFTLCSPFARKNILPSYQENAASDNTIPLSGNHDSVLQQSHLFFHVTYWMFYPYNEGKAVCTINKKFPFPIPLLFNKCYGQYKDYGNHIGDWEHISMLFEGYEHPKSIYISVHDAGAYYLYDRINDVFRYERQETRSGIIQKPSFPKLIRLYGEHPILFAAKGSHGFWPEPGRHKYVRMSSVYDSTGFGVPWNTWQRLKIYAAGENDPDWMRFKGRWGNPRSECHPLSKLGVNVCKQVDGPTGIPMKKTNFYCQA